MKTKLTLILIAAISILALFELSPLLKHKSIEQRFIEELMGVKSNAGDVLEVGILNSAASLSQEEKIDFTLLPGVNIPFNTKVSITVPVTYRFHILLSEKWRIGERGDYSCYRTSHSRLPATSPRYECGPALHRCQYIPKTYCRGAEKIARIDHSQFEVKRRQICQFRIGPG